MKERLKQRMDLSSPTGWWIAVLIQRFEFYSKQHNNPKRRCYAHQNHVLFQAPSAQIAYKKAVQYGQVTHNSEGICQHKKKGRWKFVGVVDLLPVYDPFEDGCEVLWIEHVSKRLSTIQAMVSDSPSDWLRSPSKGSTLDT